jgi:hypothetical protein
MGGRSRRNSVGDGAAHDMGDEPWRCGGGSAAYPAADGETVGGVKDGTANG